MKMKPPAHDEIVDVTNPEDLINIVFTEDEDNQDVTVAPPEGMCVSCFPYNNYKIIKLNFVQIPYKTIK